MALPDTHTTACGPTPFNRDKVRELLTQAFDQVWEAQKFRKVLEEFELQAGALGVTLTASTRKHLGDMLEELSWKVSGSRPDKFIDDGTNLVLELIFGTHH